jgi:hypothetical protein
MPLVRLLPHDEAMIAEAAAADRSGGAQPGMAAAAPAVTADLVYTVAGYALIAAGWLVAWLLWKWRDPAAFTPAAGMTAFAPLYIFAQAIERLLEPFSSFLGKATAPTGVKVQKQEAMSSVLTAISKGQAAPAAEWKRTVDQIRHNTAVITWSVATFLGTVASGAFGVLLVGAVGFNGMPAEVDMLVTGLAIGSGTKPLHDLISNLQKAKENREDPPEARGSM